FLPLSGDHRDLHSFPTRRSSDLRSVGPGDVITPAQNHLSVVVLSILHSEITQVGVPRNGHPGSHPRPVNKIWGIVTNSSSQVQRSEEHTSELQSRENLVCRLLLE